MQADLLSIPVVFHKQFPENFINSVNGWNFTAEEIENTAGKILTMDIDFGNFCSLNCPHCFRKNNQVDIDCEQQMSYDDLINVVDQAKKLGLKSVKFLGAGEPFENERFIEFLRYLKSNDIIPCIFTKGHVIGNDALTKKWNQRYGITTGQELVEELQRVNASILLGFNSFDPVIQNKMVGNIPEYTQKRNRALRLLVEAGFNNSNPTRLSVIATPLTNENYDELFDIYQWARIRNIYIVMCPTMVSGRCSKEKAWQKITPSEEKLIDLYVNIYRFNVKRGIQTLNQIEEEGISAYAGAHPCNQTACGMYITLSGKVLRCPGDDVTVFGNVFSESVEDIWKKSENYKRAGTFNCGCPPKYGKSIPYGFFKKIINNLLQS